MAISLGQNPGRPHPHGPSPAVKNARTVFHWGILAFSLRGAFSLLESNPQCHLLVGTEPPGAAETDSELPAGDSLLFRAHQQLRGAEGVLGKPVPEMVPVSLLQASSAWSPGDPGASWEQLRAQAISCERICSTLCFHWSVLSSGAGVL